MDRLPTLSTDDSVEIASQSFVHRGRSFRIAISCWLAPSAAVEPTYSFYRVRGEEEEFLDVEDLLGAELSEELIREELKTLRGGAPHSPRFLAIVEALLDAGLQGEH